MKAQEFNGTPYYAHTSLEAPVITIVASGTYDSDNRYTPENEKVHASVKAIGGIDGADALIKLKASKAITVDYNDNDGGLNKETKQDVFYSAGQDALILIEAPSIEINNNYGKARGQSADVRTIFFANQKSKIEVNGKTMIFGNTVAKEGGNVSLNLAKGSELTGAVYDHSFPSNFDDSTNTFTTYHDAGAVEVKGSPDSYWNVKPFVDDQGRGLIFNSGTKQTWSTVSLISGYNDVSNDNLSTKENPFIVNLDAGTPIGEENRLQRLDVTKLEKGGFVQFNLRLDGQNGSASGVTNGRDHVQIASGD